ncbi:Protein GPA-17 [Aphelenchoides avenae]|nr:Protein GPA-17 [Aphelenchus avenae]
MGFLCCHGDRSDKHASDERPQVSSAYSRILGSASTTTVVRQLHLLAGKTSMYRLCDEDWNNADPNKDEAHIRSTAVDVHQYRLKVHQMRIEITDVGGQRSEPNFILLVVSMADYNVKLEGHKGTLLDDCVGQMKVLLDNEEGRNCGLIIFFDNDGFKEKLADDAYKEDISYLAPFLDAETLSEYFNEGTFDEGKMSRAIANKFSEALKEVKNRRKSSYSRYTYAEDTKMMEAIFCAVKDDLVQDSLRRRHGGSR